jgi:Tautomerase enzyme
MGILEGRGKGINMSGTDAAAPGVQQAGEAADQAARTKTLRLGATITWVGLALILIQVLFDIALQFSSWWLQREVPTQLRPSGSYPIGLVVLLVGVGLMAFAFFMSRPARKQPANEQQPADSGTQEPLGNKIITHVSIATRKGWIADNHAGLANAVDAAVTEILKISERNRTLRIVEHEPDQFLAPPGHGQRFTLIEIAAPGCSPKTKRELYQAVAGKLQAVGVPSKDVRIRFVEIPPENWG